MLGKGGGWWWSAFARERSSWTAHCKTQPHGIRDSGPGSRPWPPPDGRPASVDNGIRARQTSRDTWHTAARLRDSVTGPRCCKNYHNSKCLANPHGKRNARPQPHPSDKQKHCCREPRVQTCKHYACDGAGDAEEATLAASAIVTRLTRSS
jgi:hypothetical protein